MGVRLVGPHDERTARLLQERLDRRVAEADRAASPQAFAETRLVEIWFLLLDGRVTP